jgi:hypothetical protein
LYIRSLNTQMEQHVLVISPIAQVQHHEARHEREESRRHVIYSLAQNTKGRRVGGATLSAPPNTNIQHKHATA